MLERKISDDLLEWKRSGTGKALLLTGARQIGKSYAVREFAKHEYAHYLEINREQAGGPSARIGERRAGVHQPLYLVLTFNAHSR